MGQRPDHTGQESAEECLRWADWWTREAGRQRGNATRVAEAEHHARYWARRAGPVAAAVPGPGIDPEQLDMLAYLEEMTS